MEQQTIDKLMEIKKLYEAGILTKEEMEAEKNKVLHLGGIVNEEPVSEETISDAVPAKADSEERFAFGKARPEQKQTNSSSKQQTGKSNSKLYWIGGIGILVLIIILMIILNRKDDEPTYYFEEAATDSITYDEPSTTIYEAVSEHHSQATNSYEERAENYIAGLDSETKVVANLTDKERHRVYTLVEVEAGWERVKNLYCHDLETGSTCLVNVPYQVEDTDIDQVSDAKLVGDNLYIINTSYQCGDSVACLNTLTGNWSCIVSECGEAKFTGINKLEYTISTLIHEGESNLDNAYSYETKSITLK